MKRRKNKTLHKLFIISILIILLGIYYYKHTNKTIDYTKYLEKQLNNITYPYYNYKPLDTKIHNIVSSNKDSNIEYTIYNKDNILNIFFIIDNKKYESIFINTKNNIQLNNNDILDISSIKDLILTTFNNKYSTYINNIIKDNFNSYKLKLSKEGITIYYDKTLFEGINYDISLTLDSNNEVVVSTNTYDKVIAFTFDDGPSEYSKSIMEALLLNDSKATFFELGNRMKYNQDTTKTLVDNGMEVASHTYSHKSLTSLSDSEIESEINSTNILFKEITGKDIPLLRPPYGNYKTRMKSLVNTPVIFWNVDTNDWLYRDSTKVYNHILENATDGDIILMHDTYRTTLEAVKMVLPELKRQGYKITSVTDLSNIKGINLEKGESYRYIR